MAEKRENSVLFSLRELRKIEDKRVQQEEDDARRREEEARQKKLAEEQRVRDDEERRRRDMEDEERRRIDEGERQKREDELRLEETERRARVDAAARLEEQKLRLEMEHRAQLAAKKKPWGLISAAGVLVCVVAGLGIFALVERKKHDEEAAIAAAALAQRDERLREFQRQYDELSAVRADDDKKYNEAIEGLRQAKDAEARKAAEDHIAAVERQRKEHADQLERLRLQKEAEAKRPVDTSNCPPNQPLCGLKR